MPLRPALSRRALLRSAATSAAASAVGLPVLRAGLVDPAFAQDAPPGEDAVRVYMIVIDGLRPDEVWQMPTVSQLATEGFYLPHSRAQMVAETTPNHVSMITGMRVDRHGMPGNDVAYVDGNVGEQPRYLQADTIFSLAARQAPDLVTAAATSKVYIVAMSRHERVDPGTADADATNDPVIVPVSEAAIDAEVGPDALQLSTELDPDLLWMSLGDVDRAGHTDPTGNVEGPTGAAPAFRTAVLQSADLQVRNLVTALQQDGRWASTVVILTADHSMDWSLPDAIVSLSPAFEAQPTLAGQVGVAQNGGAAMWWLLAPDAPEAPEQLRLMREIALATEGVAEAWTTRPNPADPDAFVGDARPDWGLTGDRTGDLVVVAQPGYRITEPSATSNLPPGNHGHVVTLPIPMVVAGGWDGLVPNDVVPLGPLGGTVTVPEPAPDERRPDQGENIDVAPTAAWLLGLHPPPGGFDGRVLEEAFSRRPQTRVPVADVPSVPRFDRGAGEDRIGTAVALSRLAFPDPAEGGIPGLVVVAAGDFPDALAATPLAAALGGPLLLTPPDALPGAVAEEIRRLAPGTVAIVGGPAAVSEDVETAVTGLGVATVTRLAGETRYGTAAAIATAIAEGVGGGGSAPVPGFAATPGVGGADGGGSPSAPGFAQVPGLPGGGSTTSPDVVLASGEAFPDALVAGPLAARSGRVVLLTAVDALPAETVEALAALAPRRVLIAGGPAAVSAEVEAALRSGRLSPEVTLDGLVVERLGGDDRFATAAALVERTIREGGFTDRAFLVAGGAFPDALAAGAAVARLGGMLLPLAAGPLTSSGAVAELLARRADGLVQVTVVGGPSAVSAGLAEEVAAVVTAVRTRPTGTPARLPD